MGLFSKPEVVILKESSDAKDCLKRLEELLPKASGDTKKKIEKEMANIKAGIIGEDNILFELKNSGMNLVVLHDLYIKTESGLNAQIDFLVIAPKFKYIFECKNLYGNIEINSNGDFIRTVQYGNKFYKEGIYSPITQNERHLTVLKECRTENDNTLMRVIKNHSFNTYYKGMVVLANPKTVVNDTYAKKEIKQQVIRADQLIKYIKETESTGKDSISMKDMIKLGEKYLAMNCQDRPDYLEKYDELSSEIGLKNSDEISSETELEVLHVSLSQAEISNTEQTADISDMTSIASDSVSEEGTEMPSLKLSNDDDIICPRCGSKMVLRIAKKGKHAGQQFYGCSNFPKCRFVKNMAD